MNFLRGSRVDKAGSQPYLSAQGGLNGRGALAARPLGKPMKSLTSILFRNLPPHQFLPVAAYRR
jgi:hypothetical protein